MSGEISFLQNGFNSLNFNLNTKNDNFEPKYRTFLNDSCFESCYEVEKIIGSGGFAVVYSGIRKADNKQYAIKHIDKKKITSWFSEKDGVEIPTEIVLLIETSGVEGVSKMLEYFERPDSFILILAKPANCSDLFDQITAKERLGEEQARRVFVDVIGIVISLQQLGIFHNDVKDENILLDLDTHKVILIDFGAAVRLPEGAPDDDDDEEDDLVTEFEGTRVYSPPEWVEMGEMSLRAGCVWSMGVLLYNMLCGDVPYRTDADIVANVLPPSPHISGDCRHLIKSCLQYHPHLRPPLSALLTHPWVLNNSNNNNNDN